MSKLVLVLVVFGVLAGGAAAATPAAKPDCAKLVPAAFVKSVLGYAVTVQHYDAGSVCLYRLNGKKVLDLAIKYKDGGAWYRRASPGIQVFVDRCNAAGGTNCPTVESLHVGTVSSTAGVENFVLAGKTSLGMETNQNPPPVGGSNLSTEQRVAILRKLVAGLAKL